VAQQVAQEVGPVWNARWGWNRCAQAWHGTRAPSVRYRTLLLRSATRSMRSADRPGVFTCRSSTLRVCVRWPTDHSVPMR